MATKIVIELEPPPANATTSYTVQTWDGQQWVDTYLDVTHPDTARTLAKDARTNGERVRILGTLTMDYVLEEDTPA